MIKYGTSETLKSLIKCASLNPANVTPISFGIIRERWKGNERGGHEAEEEKENVEDKEKIHYWFLLAAKLLRSLSPKYKD